MNALVAGTQEFRNRIDEVVLFSPLSIQQPSVDPVDRIANRHFPCLPFWCER